ncbi:MAG TPA: FAD-dependent oxidoreductase [Terriglobales bacterium]|nr:FAD-dependent oxidoreductase [Terriglobales bacterium]
MSQNANQRQPLSGQHFQVAVIGGGIVGVAIARECARAGKRTLLVEQHDFASGSTSRSTRLVSGLRVLEQGNIGLAREMLREKQRLLRERSHLVHPAHFLLALRGKSTRSALSVRTGLWLYRRLAGSATDAAGVEMERKKLEASLDAGERWSIFDYEDAQCEFPERLTAEWLGEAVAASAVARNHTQVLAVDLAHGRARGLWLRDWISNREEKVEATWIINATGAWADRLCQHSSVKTRAPMVRGVRGSHIVLSHFPGAPAIPLYSIGIDGRPLSVIPWNEQVLVGATEAEDGSDPGKVHPALDEIEYLLRSLGQLFPRARLSQQDIRYAFAGVRAVPRGTREDGAFARHCLHDHTSDGAARLISVVGGTLATATKVARDCARKVGIRVTEPQVLAVAAGAGLDLLLDQLAAEISALAGIHDDAARAMVEWHGKRALAVARMARSSVELRTPICPHSDHIVAEAVQAYVHEGAVKLGDVLLRRVPVALGPCWSEACSREAALRIGAVLGWNEDAIGANLEGLEMERAAFLRRPRTEMRLRAAAD